MTARRASRDRAAVDPVVRGTACLPGADFAFRDPDPVRNITEE
jgi:hypothetical protein